MRLGLRAIVEAENAFDDAVEVGGDCERAGAAAICAGSVFVTAEAGSESVVESLNCAGEFYGAAGAIFAGYF